MHREFEIAVSDEEMAALARLLLKGCSLLSNQEVVALKRLLERYENVRQARDEKRPNESR